MKEQFIHSVINIYNIDRIWFISWAKTESVFIPSFTFSYEWITVVWSLPPSLSPINFQNLLSKRTLWLVLDGRLPCDVFCCIYYPRRYCWSQQPWLYLWSWRSFLVLSYFFRMFLTSLTESSRFRSWVWQAITFIMPSISRILSSIASVMRTIASSGRVIEWTAHFVFTIAILDSWSGSGISTIMPTLNLPRSLFF